MKKKLIMFCIAVGLSLTLAATSFAGPTIFLDADSLTPGTYDGTGSNPPSLTFSSPYGPITFVGELKGDTGGDAEFIAAGASGHVFDVPHVTPEAELSWTTFEVLSVTFVYGGNAGDITDPVANSDICRLTGTGICERVHHEGLPACARKTGVSADLHVGNAAPVLLVLGGDD